MSERNLRVRLGIFVVVSLVLLAGMILLFGSLPPLFTSAVLAFLAGVDL